MGERKVRIQKENKDRKKKGVLDRETATYGGLRLSLKRFDDRLEWHRGYKLNSKPREINCVKN